MVNQPASVQVSRLRHPPGFFVTGTDTGVGKTRVVCWLARLFSESGARVGVCKPAVTGAERTADQWRWDDVERLRAVAPADVPVQWIAPNRWLPPLSPPAAARWHSEFGTREIGAMFPLADAPSLLQLNASADIWQDACDFLLMEGIGGLLCPLTETATVADLALAFGRPVIIVARRRLGTLNHSLLTYEAACRRGLKVAGILLNADQPEDGSPAESSNLVELQRRVPVRVWGPLPYCQDDEPPSILRTIDWRAIAIAASGIPWS